MLLPLECYYPGQPNGGNTCQTGSLAVADAIGRLDAPEELADLLADRLRSPGGGEQRRVVYA